MDIDGFIDVLPVHECWARLRSHEVGRLAVVTDGQPDVFPVNYVVDHGSIVFRTATGTKLAAIAAGSRVAFEVDGEADGMAYSIVLKGAARALTDRCEQLDTLDLPLHPWQRGAKPTFVRVEPDVVTGRLFEIADRRSLHGEQPRRRAPVE